jgi:hypothetical protein
MRTPLMTAASDLFYFDALIVLGTIFVVVSGMMFLAAY